jgi:hypothetical protein
LIFPAKIAGKNFFLSVHAQININLRVQSIVDHVYLSLRNADLLVRAVIIKLTSRRKGRIRREGVEGERFEREVLNGLDCFSLTVNFFRFHSVTCSYIIGLREFVTDFFSLCGIFRGFSQYLSLKEVQRNCDGREGWGGGQFLFCVLTSVNRPVRAAHERTAPPIPLVPKNAHTLVLL